MSNYSPIGFRMMPPVVKNLLIINILMFIGTIVAESKFGIDLTRILGLYYPESSLFRPYQIVTYMFMHGGFTHILFNMFALWMFGSAIENIWGPRRFFIYYFVTGIGAVLVNFLVFYLRLYYFEMHLSPEFIHEIQNGGMKLLEQGMNYSDENGGGFNILYNFSMNVPTVGASGAIFGLLLAFGMIFPNAQLMLLFPPIPIKGKYIAIVALITGVFFDTQGNVAHFAHLGGMLFGFILLKYWKGKQFKRLN